MEASSPGGNLGHSAFPDGTSLVNASFRTLYDAFVIYDFEGTPLTWNGAYCELVGCTDDEIREHKAWDFHEIEEVDFVAETFFRVLMTGRPEYIEVGVRRKDGTVIPCGLSGSAVFDGDNRPVALCGVGRDLTKHKRADEIYDVLLKNAIDGYCVCDLQGNILDCNDAYCRMLGSTRMEIEGTNLVDAGLLVDVAEVRRRVEEVMRGGHTTFEIKQKRMDGAVIDIEASVTFDEVERGRLYAFVRDITVRKKVEAELAEHRSNLEGLIQERTAELEETNERLRREIVERVLAEKELLRLNKELDAYAQTVSHELRTPLSGIYLALEYLERMAGEMSSEKVYLEVETILEKAKATVQRAEEQVEKLLELAKAGQVPDEVSEVDVASVVEHTMKDVEEEILHRGAEVNIGRDLGVVRANETHVLQVFSNLVSNAVRHCDSSEPFVEVRCLGMEPEGGIRYLVRDNGSGIPAELLDDIFSPFPRDKGGRTGIGLVTVSKILKIYGGEIAAYNDGGACFEFVFRDYRR